VGTDANDRSSMTDTRGSFTTVASLNRAVVYSKSDLGLTMSTMIGSALVEAVL
jgi:hypothetical protein